MFSIGTLLFAGGAVAHYSFMLQRKDYYMKGTIVNKNQMF
jgi:hypothetical protein